MRSFSLNTNMYEMRMASVAMSAIRLRLCGENGANAHTNCPNDEPSSTPSVTMPQPMPNTMMPESRYVNEMSARSIQISTLNVP